MEGMSTSKKVDGKTGKLAGDPPAQIMKFQKEEACDANIEEIPLKDYRRLKREVPKREEKGAKLKERLEIEKTTRSETKAERAAENTRRTEEKAMHKEKKTKFVKDRLQDLSVGEGIYASELEKRVENFVKQLDANEKSRADYSNFEFLKKDLGKDWITIRGFDVPACLAPISDRLFRTFDDFTSDSLQSDCAAAPSFVLFCAAIKEMEDMKLDQIDEDKMLLWRDAINSALNVQFKVDFAIKHLKKIARAYFGLKTMETMEWESREELKNIDRTVKKTEVPEDCLRDAQYFRGKPLNTGLFN